MRPRFYTRKCHAHDLNLCESTALPADWICGLLLSRVMLSRFRWMDRSLERSVGTCMESPPFLVLADISWEEFEHLASLSVPTQKTLMTIYATFFIFFFLFFLFSAQRVPEPHGSATFADLMSCSPGYRRKPTSPGRREQT